MAGNMMLYLKCFHYFMTWVIFDTVPMLLAGCPGSPDFHPPQTENGERNGMVSKLPESTFLKKSKHEREVLLIIAEYISSLNPIVMKCVRNFCCRRIFTVKTFCLELSVVPLHCKSWIILSTRWVSMLGALTSPLALYCNPRQRSAFPWNAPGQELVLSPLLMLHRTLASYA